MVKLKTKPSAKIHRRYILFEKGTKKQVQDTILDYIGILGWAEAKPVFIEDKERRLILAVDRKSLEKVKASFEISNKDIRVKRVSGTIKGLEK